MTLERALWLCGIALSLLLGMRAGRAQVRVERIYRERRKQRRALEGEREAAEVLAHAGFRVEEQQVTVPFALQVDGERLEVELRADYLVSRGGRYYVAEVKTGDEAPSPRTANTRRQLLEYTLAYQVDGTLLVDMENQTVHEVGFPQLGPQPVVSDPWWLRGLAWALVGAAATYYGARYLGTQAWLP